MGTPMAGHLARAGYPLSVHDVDPAKPEAVAAEHPSVRIAPDARSVAQAADIVITMLPSGEYVHEVALGDAGLIEGFAPGSLLLDTSSCEPWLTVRTAAALAGVGVDMVDAPVSGALAGARAAELVFMVGGGAEAVGRVTPLLDLLGKQSFHLGPVGAGHAMKCINNLITATTFMATAEGLTIGARFGLDPDVMTDVLNVSTGMSWISQTHIKQRITSRAFDDPFKLALMVKDVGIALELAKREKLPLPLSEGGHTLWEAAGRSAEEGASISEMVRWLERETGTQIGGTTP
ncbi:MAG: NAD(P)-dependent oxidoreductase [Actinobacteria bacterium]|nr:NAD(P)-dependent oxidoreductase [Actinomycetota bacterium]